MSIDFCVHTNTDLYFFFHSQIDQTNHNINSLLHLFGVQDR